MDIVSINNQYAIIDVYCYASEMDITHTHTELGN